MPQTDEQLSIDQIYQKLTQGLGHEFVNDDNVFALIEWAERDRYTVLLSPGRCRRGAGAAHC